MIISYNFTFAVYFEEGLTHYQLMLSKVGTYYVIYFQVYLIPSLIMYGNLNI